MTDLSLASRRHFLLLAGGGVAAAGAATLAPARLLTELPARRAGGGGPMVAYVSDVGTGRIDLLAGDREVVIHDRDLATRLWEALS